MRADFSCSKENLFTNLCALRICHFMRATFKTSDAQEWTVDLSKPIDISIPLQNDPALQPNAYGAPYYTASPVRVGEFTGSLDAGAPVNFFDIALNPHGNGTHTECVGHILAGPYTIRQCLQRSHYTAELISVIPRTTANGAQIAMSQLAELCRYHTEALIVRTLPNREEKQYRKYTGTNPPYFEPDAMQWIADRGYVHLLTDLPSVDPEVDGGALLAHQNFWDTHGRVRPDRTITELVFVPQSVPDGLYLLDLHTVSLDLDVSPSRPMLYVIE